MRRLDMGTIRICRRCGRGRAELVGDGGDSLSVRLGPSRARLLADLDAAGPAADVPWLGDLLVRRARELGMRVSDVVFDAGPRGLRGLVSYADGAGATTVAACEPEEALEVAVRAGVPIFATDEALRRDPTDERTGHTLH